MKLNDMLSDLLYLAKQENEPNRYAHSEEYDKLYDELDSKTLVIDELEGNLGCPLDVLGKIILQKYFFDIYGNKRDTDIGYVKGREDIVLNLDEWKDKFWVGKDTVIYLNGYKKTWWLKADRSE